MDDYEHHNLRIADITRDANYALWNGLLTLNGIIISVFSAVAVFSPGAKVLVVIIIAIAMLSALLLILNFRSTRNQYRLIGQIGIAGVEGLSPQHKEQQLAAASRAHEWCNRRETVTNYILAIQGALILILVYFKS
jgi:hypothetical protein